jgi:hypothetical protein
MRALADIFSSAGIPYEFHLHTEVLTKPVLVTPGHHGICDRIKDSVLLSSADSKMEEFAAAEIPGLVLHINEYPVDTLKALTMADVLLASRSSFSYVASILKSGGVILFHPFWHSLAPGWIPARSGKDIYDSSGEIIRGLKR